MNRREAFCAAVIKFRSPEWSPAFPDNERFEVDDEHQTIRQVCALVKEDKEELPDVIFYELVEAMHGDRRLHELLDRSPTYAAGSQCLSELLEDRVRTLKAKG